MRRYPAIIAKITQTIREYAANVFDHVSDGSQHEFETEIVFLEKTLRRYNNDDVRTALSNIIYKGPKKTYSEHATDSDIVTLVHILRSRADEREMHWAMVTGPTKEAAPGWKTYTVNQIKRDINTYMDNAYKYRGSLIQSTEMSLLQDTLNRYKDNDVRKAIELILVERHEEQQPEHKADATHSEIVTLLHELRSKEDKIFERAASQARENIDYVGSLGASHQYGPTYAERAAW